MAIEVFIERGNKRELVDVNGKIKVADLIKKLNINPVTVLAVKNGELVTEDTFVGNNDKIKLMSVVSGG